MEAVVVPLPLCLVNSGAGECWAGEEEVRLTPGLWVVAVVARREKRPSGEVREVQGFVREAQAERFAVQQRQVALQTGASAPAPRSAALVAWAEVGDQVSPVAVPPGRISQHLIEAAEQQIGDERAEEKSREVASVHGGLRARSFRIAWVQAEVEVLRLSSTGTTLSPKQCVVLVVEEAELSGLPIHLPGPEAGGEQAQAAGSAPLGSLPVLASGSRR